MKKVFAAILIAALIVAAPGPFCYEALAQFSGRRGGVPSSRTPSTGGGMEMPKVNFPVSPKMAPPAGINNGQAAPMGGAAQQAPFTPAPAAPQGAAAAHSSVETSQTPLSAPGEVLQNPDSQSAVVERLKVVLPAARLADAKSNAAAGVLGWVFDKYKTKAASTGQAQEVVGKEAVIGSGLSPATARTRAASAEIPAASPAAAEPSLLAKVKTVPARIKNIFDLAGLKSTYKIYYSQEGKEAEALTKLSKNLEKLGLAQAREIVVDEPVSDRPTVAILAPASIHKLAIAQEGGRQAPGEVHLALDPSWFIKEMRGDGSGHRLFLKKGLYFDKDGQAVVAEYKTPRPVRYFGNFYTLGANGRNDGVALEEGLDVPMSSSHQLEKETNDKVLTRVLSAAHNIEVPVSIAFLMPGHPPLPQGKLDAAAHKIKVFAMPRGEDRRAAIGKKVDDFLSRYQGEEVVVKPSGPEFHSGEGVKILPRGEREAIIDHVLSLSAHPSMQPEDAVLFEERLVSPALYMENGRMDKSGRKKDWNFRVIAARAPWNGAVTTGIFARAGTWGIPTTGEPKNPADAAEFVRFEDIVQGLRDQHGVLKTEKEASAFLARLKELGEKALFALVENEVKRPVGHGEPKRAQTDMIGLDVMVVVEGGKLVPKIIEFNDHDAGGQPQLDKFYPEKAGQHSREWIATMLARARRDAMKGKRIVLVGAGYPNKKFFLETAKSLGVKVILIDKGLTGAAKLKDMARVKLGYPSRDNWAKDLVSEFIAVDTTHPEEALAVARKKLQRSARKNGKIDGITTYWEDDVVLTAQIAEAMGLRYHPVKSAKLVRDKAATREFLKEKGLASMEFRTIESREDMEKAVADPAFPFPAFLKPRNGAEGQFSGVVERENALRIFNEVQKGIAASQDTIFDQGRGFILEEYLTGHEWDVNLMVQDGKLVYATLTDNTPVREDKLTLKPGEKRQLNSKSTGAHKPSIQLTLEEEAQAKAFAAKVVLAQGFSDGVFHVEGKSGPRGPRLLENNARPGGSYVVHWDYAVDGVDQSEMIFLAAAGVPAFPFKAPEPLTHLAGSFIFSEREGKIKSISLREDALGLGVKLLAEKKPGAVVDFQDNDRVAFLQAEAGSVALAKSKLGPEPKNHLILDIVDAEIR